MSSRLFLAGVLLVLPTIVLAQPPAASSAGATTQAAVPQTGPANAIVGVWSTPDNKSHVRIYRAANGTFNGKIIWLKNPSYPADYKDSSLAGQPRVDIHNPDKSLRSRPVIDLDVLKHFKYVPTEDNWQKGSCYDPEDGKSYTCTMWLETSDKGGTVLKVRGYVWIFHKTQTWHRYEASAPPSARTATSPHATPSAP